MSLKALQVADAIRSGADQKLADGNNLYLVVRKGRGFWALQYCDGKKIRSKGLGAAAKITPAQARRAREEFIVAWRLSLNGCGCLGCVRAVIANVPAHM
jgi:hypothetical protein